MSEDNLIGLWSADALYGLGAQSDEVLVFKPDGTGRYEFINWTLCSADLFRWEVRDSGVLRMVGEKCLKLSADARQIQEECSSLGDWDLEYRVATEATPSGKSMLVLRLALQRPRTNCFGLIRRDLVGFEEPGFDI